MLKLYLSYWKGATQRGRGGRRTLVNAMVEGCGLLIPWNEV